MFIIHLQKFLDRMWISCLTIVIGDFNINMFNQNSAQPNELQSFMDQRNFNFKKLHQFMDPILITYGQMHPLNNECQELFKLIGLTINQYILHSNSHITSHNTMTKVFLKKTLKNIDNNNKAKNNDERIMTYISHFI
jgi:hypothetical protein